MTDNKDYAFVYGTLKGMERRFDGVRKVGAGVTVEPFILFDGGFPLAITPDDDEAKDRTNAHARIVGEVYEVSAEALENLDDYEGTHPSNEPKDSFYYRKPITIALEGGVEVTAWMYLGGTAKHGIPDREVLLPDELGQVNWR